MSSFHDLLRQIRYEEEAEQEESFDEFPLLDEPIHHILMHRDIHFSGKFDYMIDYYRQDGVGIDPEIEISEILKLRDMEKKFGKNLSDELLSPYEKEKIRNAKKAYEGLEKLSEIATSDVSLPSLLTDLILTEEEVPEKEIARLASYGDKALPYLVNLLTSDEFYDPLYPGYGRAPIHVADCLGKIGKEEAIVPLFESLGKDCFSYEETVLSALKNIGEKAETFLYGVLAKKPVGKDNALAASALTAFPDQKTFAQKSLQLLRDDEVMKEISLAVHLLSACTELTEMSDVKLFIEMEGRVPNALTADFRYVLSKLKPLRP